MEQNNIRELSDEEAQAMVEKGKALIAEFNKDVENHKAGRDSNPTITCPYCSSTDCKKLGAVSRGVSFGLFGFGSGSIGKQWKCRKCGSAF